MLDAIEKKEIDINKMDKKNDDIKTKIEFQKIYDETLKEIKVYLQLVPVGSKVFGYKDNEDYYWYDNRILDIFNIMFELINNNRNKFYQYTSFFDNLEEQGFLKRISYDNKYTSYITTLKNFKNIKTNTLFVAREFNFEKSFKFYEKLKQAILKSKLFEDVVMLEEKGKAGSITEYMENCIEECEFFIADLSTNRTDNEINLNVVYELGMAKGFGKHTFQIINENSYKKIKNKSKTLPFDIRDKNTIIYSDDERNWNKNINDILEVIKNTLIPS